MSKIKTRIVENIHPDGRVEYVIQVKHFLFRGWWVDAASCPTLEKALENLCYFDGTEVLTRVVAVDGKLV